MVRADRLVRFLGAIAHFFTWPRRLLRALWPGESTPAALNYLLYLANWLVWGTLVAAIRFLRKR